jgi:hypothetical protein
LLKGSKFATPDGNTVVLGAGTGMGLFLGAELADVTHNILISMLLFEKRKEGITFPNLPSCDYIVNIDDVAFETVDIETKIN